VVTSADEMIDALGNDVLLNADTPQKSSAVKPK